MSGAGDAEANGVYIRRFGGKPKEGDTLGCITGIYEHTANTCWLGFQDCSVFGHPEWNKWVLFNPRGVLYAAHTDGAAGVPPREGTWELAPWAAADANPSHKKLGDILS